MWRGPRWRSAPYGLVAAGFLVLLIAGSAAGRYSPGWFDPGDPLPCHCSTGEAASARESLWGWVAVGGALVLAGLVLFTLRLERAPRRPAGPLPSGAHALVAGMVGFVVPAVLFLPVLVLVLVSGHLVPAAVLGTWLAHAAAITGVDRAIGPAGSSPRRSWLVGLAAGALGSGAAWAVLLAGATARNWSPAVVDGAVVALVVLAARTSRAVGTISAVAAVALTGVAVLGPGVLLPRPEPVAAAPSTPPAPTTEPPVPPPTPLPAPETKPAPAPPVEADAPCAPQELRFDVPGFDGALGARGASIQATNVGVDACWMEGIPAVTLWQGGHPLDLTVEPGQTPMGYPATAHRVAIAPGGTALALLTWRTYGGWADAETAQSVTVALSPDGPPSDVLLPAGFGAAPFDLADGGAWGIAPWAPPWN